MLWIACSGPGPETILSSASATVDSGPSQTQTWEGLGEPYLTGRGRPGLGQGHTLKAASACRVWGNWKFLAFVKVSPSKSGWMKVAAAQASSRGSWEPTLLPGGRPKGLSSPWILFSVFNLFQSSDTAQLFFFFPHWEIQSTWGQLSQSSSFSHLNALISPGWLGTSRHR